ncbi:hypothetical protein J4573_14375 [Actinomadura barringtoniae]|uniref:Uncharacterized protein n=1 Tax=Actinomadura barringtoniae TaxID=1427535 RepID=A0A939P8Z9_9ACTN|nr:hypothetical protein [Actinomadura barringtoniae]MBO2448287.1 hypothetical protein [Actinomadura barringtoniae]
MTDAGDDQPPDTDRPSREELDQQVRDHYGTWRDQPKGLACVVIAAFGILTTVAFGLAILAFVLAVR